VEWRSRGRVLCLDSVGFDRVRAGIFIGGAIHDVA
jgi:hypothetical protein